MIGPLFDAGPPAPVPLVTLPLLEAFAEPDPNGPPLAVVVLEAVEVPLPPVTSTVLLPPAPPGPPAAFPPLP